MFARAAFGLQKMGFSTGSFLAFVLLCLQKFCRKMNKGDIEWF